MGKASRKKREKNSQEPKMDDREYAERLAKFIALNCFRNSELENLHAGTAPSSKTGDFSDVKVVSPYGEIPWNKLSRLTDPEMKVLMKDVVNKTFTFIYGFLKFNEVPTGLLGFQFPEHWDKAEIDEGVQGVWDLLQGALEGKSLDEMFAERRAKRGTSLPE